ncbi:NUDIX hydrolase [Candidatus Nomurabacteria bacterium]|nr:NUDIX hydrolase [Candidatus Nomurabacteria bacterium]
MANICDHKSVGMLVYKEDKILLIERGRSPFAFAMPAGHVDEDATFEEAAIRELKEEVGVDAKSIELVAEGRKENKGRRVDCTWHYWKIYKVEVEGKIDRSLDETKQAGFYSIDQIKIFAERTEKYLNKEIEEEEWNKNPGLEPVMYEWFKELKII